MSFLVAKTYNVIEDIKLLGIGEIISGFIPVDKCLDNSTFIELTKINKVFL